MPEHQGNRGKVGNNLPMTLISQEVVVRGCPGLAGYLMDHPAIQLRYFESGISEALEVCREAKPCIFIADTSFLDSIEHSGFATSAEFGRSIKVLVLGEDNDSEQCERVLRMGCSGIISTDASSAVFGRALNAVELGEIWASRKATASLIRDLLADNSPRKLTPREREILSLIALGHHNAEVANLLFISRETVRWHVRSIYAKLGARDREFAVAQARAAGEIEPAKKSIKGERPDSAAQRVG